MHGNLIELHLPVTLTSLSKYSIGDNYKLTDIYYDGNTYNPCIFSPNAPYAIFFEQTQDSLNTNTDLINLKQIDRDECIELFEKYKKQGKTIY